MSRSPTHKPPRLRSVASPKQARSEATLHRLLDAAEGLIEDKGLADVSVPDIVARAGSSVGGFYARFKDKGELLRALEERFLREMRDLLDGLADPGRWHDGTIADIVRVGVDTLLRVFDERRPLLAAFMAQAANGRGDELQDILEFRREVSARFVDLLKTRSEDLDHPDPEVAVDLAIQILFGFMNQLIVFGEVRVGDRRLGHEELAAELARNVLRYIGYSERVASASRPDPSAPHSNERPKEPRKS